MADTVPFAIVDVFSKTPFKGNPLAIVDNTSADLSTEQMRLIARQFNLSETTFFSRPQNSPADFTLRSFLPNGREVYGAGHNILGVWWHLAKSGLLDLSKESDKKDNTRAQTFVFKQLLGGEVSNVQIVPHQSSLSVSLRQSPPCIGNKHLDPCALAAAIDLKRDDIGLANATDLSPQVVSTSTTRHLHVLLRSIEALDRVVVQKDKLLEQLKLVDDKAYGLFLFAAILGKRDK